MSYHNVNAPLADCTAQTMQDANQSYHTRKAHSHAHNQAPAVVLPKSFSHNPYVGVIPGTVDEMMRILESRRLQQTSMRRTFSSPNFFNTQLNSPQSPLQGGAASANAGGRGGSSPINQFPRIASAPMFFEEPEVLSRSTSPLMMQPEMMASFGDSTSSFSRYGNQSTTGSPTMTHGSPTQQAPSARSQRTNTQRNSSTNNAAHIQQQQQQTIQKVATRNTAGPSERRAMELPVPASIARQQQLQGAPKQHNNQARVEPSQRPRTPVQQAAMSSANTSTDSAGVITKVYQNGRPVPRMLAEEGETTEIPRPKTVVEAQDKNSAISIKFRNHTGNYRTSRLHLSVGDYVLVDGDRGCDLGQVLSVAEDIEVVTAENTMGSVQRSATEEEVEKFHSMEAEEAKALEFARAQATRHLNNKLTVEHVSFQFDHQKLTLWYKAAERVYFVPLLKALNQEYKCRIWMERIEDDENSIPETAATAAAVDKKDLESGGDKRKKMNKD